MLITGNCVKGEGKSSIKSKGLGPDCCKPQLVYNIQNSYVLTKDIKLRRGKLYVEGTCQYSNTFKCLGLS